MKYPCFNFLLFIFLLTISMAQFSCKKTIEGCMDKNSSNYDPEATIDDGTCTIKGCTNEHSDNYNPEATEDDGSCIVWSEKFVGDYLVTTNCSLFTPLNTPFMMTISSIGDNKVSMVLKTIDIGAIPTFGTVTNDEISITEVALSDLNVDLETPIGTITIKGFILNGDATLEIDKNLNGTIVITIETTIGNQEDLCPFTGIRQ